MQECRAAAALRLAEYGGGGGGWKYARVLSRGVEEKKPTDTRAGQVQFFLPPILCIRTQCQLDAFESSFFSGAGPDT